MTKVYNDVDALTKLLEEKERDLELAARIGQSLLDQNRNQAERIDELERDLSIAKDKITQLKHEISSKKDLLDFYLKDEEDEEILNSINDSSISSYKSVKDASILLEELERRVDSLEVENKRLKSETESKALDIEEEERKELQLINECAKRLNTANKHAVSLQEEINARNKENAHLKKDVSNLANQVTALEKKLRKLTSDNEDLESALNAAHDCQSELTIELIDVKDKHNNLLIAFHEKQDECRQLIEQQSLTDPLFAYSDSLAYELEQSIGAISNLESCDDSNFTLEKSFHNCFTPDSLLSSDSFYTSSSFPSLTTTCAQQISSSPSSKTTASSSNSTLISCKNTKSHILTNKLRYIKPIEGSQILNRWRKLASPNLNNLFDDDKEKFISRIQANLAATEVKVSVSSSNKSRSNSISNESYSIPIQNNFVTTNSVFTFTTTSLSHTQESVTQVTTSFSDVKPSIRSDEFKASLFKQQIPIESIQTNMEEPIYQSDKTKIKTKMKSSVGVENQCEKISPLKKTDSIANKQFILESLTGLNELTKMIRKDDFSMSTMMRPLNSNRRVITKVMANDSFNITDIANRDLFRTDLSVLKNLRKGGFI